jgi:serine/threonine protein kinase
VRDAQPSTGRFIDGRFELLEKLGGGGSATVYRARDQSTGGEVAIKLIHPDLPGMRSRIDREAQILAALDHPGIARSLGVRFDGEPSYLVIELVQGQPLALELGARAAVPRHFGRSEALQLLGDLLLAVGYAHRQGVLHRDLKPFNVMLTPEGKVKVLDFGVARLLDAEPDLTKATTRGRALGSVPYMSPEQVRGELLDARSDIFAVGVIAFETLSLRRAWSFGDDGQLAQAYSEPVPASPANSPAEVAGRITAGPRPVPSRHRPDLPAALDAVIARALAIDPKQRFASAEEFLAGLMASWPPPSLERRSEPPEELSTVATPTPVATVPRAGPALAFKPWLSIPALALLLLGSALAIAPARRLFAPERRPAPRLEVEPAKAPAQTADPAPEPEPSAEPSPEPTPSEEPAVPEPPLRRIPRHVEHAAQHDTRRERATPVKTPPTEQATLRRLLAEAKSSPGSEERRLTLERRILEAADRESDPKRRDRVKAIATTSGMSGDLEGLERALEELYR